jgi:hypothetical protein
MRFVLKNKMDRLTAQLDGNISFSRSSPADGSENRNYLPSLQNSALSAVDLTMNNTVFDLPIIRQKESLAENNR